MAIVACRPRVGARGARADLAFILMICFNAVRADACFVASAINGTTAWKLRRSANVHGARRRSCARLGMAAPVDSHGAEGPGPERDDIPTNSSPHRVQTNPPLDLLGPWRSN